MATLPASGAKSFIMRDPFFLQIPQACHEDWNEMSAESKGRFCGSCQKIVVDFTAMSDQQVLNYFRQKAGGDTCGRFTDEQLSKQYQQPPKPGSGWFKWVAAFVASGMFGSFKVHAQLKPDSAKVACKVQKMGESQVAPKPKDNPAGTRITMGGVATIPARKQVFVIHGSIKDEKNEPLGYCSVRLNGTNRGAAADKNGKFRIAVGADLERQKIVISSVGYISKEINIVPDMIQSLNISGDTVNMQVKAIQMQMADMSAMSVTVGAVVIAKKITRRDTVATMARKIFNTPAFKASPNPVKAGSSLQIFMKRAGVCYIELLDMNSRLVSRLNADTDPSNNFIYFPIPLTAVAGTYFIRITKPKTAKADVEKIVVY